MLGLVLVLGLEEAYDVGCEVVGVFVTEIIGLELGVAVGSLVPLQQFQLLFINILEIASINNGDVAVVFLF